MSKDYELAHYHIVKILKFHHFDIRLTNMNIKLAELRWNCVKAYEKYRELEN